MRKREVVGQVEEEGGAGSGEGRVDDMGEWWRLRCLWGLRSHLERAQGKEPPGSSTLAVTSPDSENLAQIAAHK